MIKKLFIVFVLAAPPLVACGKGCEEHQGVCACTQAPEFDSSQVKPSEEKPSRHPQPAWQRGEVTADMPSSLASKDATYDQEVLKANSEGKKAAGIK